MTTESKKLSRLIVHESDYDTLEKYGQTLGICAQAIDSAIEAKVREMFKEMLPNHVFQVSTGGAMKHPVKGKDL